MHPVSTTKRWIALASLAATTVLGGCALGSSSYVKVIHASSGATNVDIKVGNSFAAQNLAFGNATSSYAHVPAGANLSIQLFAAGKDTNALLSTTQSLQQNQYYTVLAIGVPVSLQLQVINDDLTPPKANNFKIRVVHASAAAGPVDVYVTAPGTDINNPKNPTTPTLKNLTLGTVTSYLQVASGTYEIRVTPAGNPGTTLIDSGASGTNFPAGSIYTAVALDPAPNKSASFGFLLTQDLPVSGAATTASSAM
ncbi:MAG: DUF4397 domain-containing protein [Acidobacteria bacterium]|nr:DUF4397 domain-containing protein [Acidobacteriota bacterium]